MSQTSQTKISQEIIKIADKIRPELQKQLGLTFNTYCVLDFEHYPTDVSHTSYYLKIGTDNNGHVRLRATETEDKGDWTFEVEEFDRGNVQIDPSTYLRGKEGVSGKSEGIKSQGKGVSTGMESSNP